MSKWHELEIELPAHLPRGEDTANFWTVNFCGAGVFDALMIEEKTDGTYQFAMFDRVEQYFGERYTGTEDDVRGFLGELVKIYEPLGVEIIRPHDESADR